jgi:hypothetical protein
MKQLAAKMLERFLSLYAARVEAMHDTLAEIESERETQMTHADVLKYFDGFSAELETIS